MSNLRSLWRLFMFAVITFTRVTWIIIIDGIKGPTRQLRDRHKMAWARHINRVMGLEMHIKGNYPDKGVLIVSNHRSYIDIPVLIALTPASHLAKAEVKKWPILGYGAKAVDTLFVVREKLESRANSKIAIEEMLSKGHPVCVFPEGTTSKAPEVKPFKQGAFGVCAEGGFPVIPVAIEYEDPNDAWIGDDTFIPHFMRAFSKRKRKIWMHAGPEMKGNDAQKLCNDAYEWIVAELQKIREENGIKT